MQLSVVSSCRGRVVLSLNHLLSELQLVEVIVVIDTSAQSSVVLFQHCDLVECFVDHGEVLLLHVAHVLHCKGQRVVLSQQVHYSGVVQVGCEHLEETSESEGVLQDVERDGFVLHLGVANLRVCVCVISEGDSERGKERHDR